MCLVRTKHIRRTVTAALLDSLFVATLLSLPVRSQSTCVGACHGGTAVTIDSLLTMVNIALGSSPLSTCTAGDANGDGEVTINEILAAVNNALNGCTVPLTPTATPTPQIPQIKVGSASAAPGGTVTIPVALQLGGLRTVATGNDLSYRNDLFDLDVHSCGINPAIGKTLVVSELPDGPDPTVTTVRAFVQSLQNSRPIPDGTLYSCVFNVRPSALPGCYPLTIGSPIAFAADGSQQDGVMGLGGTIGVSLVSGNPCLVPIPTPTPTPSGPLQFIQWDNTGITQADAVSESGADVDVVQNICVSGMNAEPFTQTVINATFLNNEGSDILLQGYSTQIDDLRLAQSNITGVLSTNIAGGRCSNGARCTTDSDCGLTGGITCVHSETIVSGIVLYDFVGKGLIDRVSLDHPEVFGQAIPLKVTFFGSDPNRSFQTSANYLVTFGDFDNCMTSSGGGAGAS